MRNAFSTHWLQPEDDCCRDADCRHKGLLESIVAAVDSAPFIKPAEKIRDFEALVLKHLGMWRQDFTFGVPREAGLDTLYNKCGRETVGIIAAVAEYSLGQWKFIDNFRRKYAVRKVQSDPSNETAAIHLE